MECLRVVADDTEIVADLSCELSHGNATFLAVGLVGLKIFTAERPCIGIVALNDGIEYSEIISAVAGVACIETVYRRHGLRK